MIQQMETVWIGECCCYALGGDTQEQYRILAGAWAHSWADFEAKAMPILLQAGHQLIIVEEAWPVNTVLQKYGYQQRIIELARQVSSKSGVKLGAILSRSIFSATPLAMSIPAFTKVETVTETIENFKPLDMQHGVDEKKFLPEALKDTLFPSIDNQNPPQVYAVIDAGKTSLLYDMLQESGLNFKCLFDGKAAEEFKHVAPYLVQMEEKNNFTRHLFTRSSLPADMWGKENALYFHSRDNFDIVRNRLRKLTRVCDTDKKWYFNRFWEPQYFLFLAHAMTDTAMFRSFENMEHFFIPIGDEFCKITLGRAEIRKEHAYQMDKLFDSGTSTVVYRHILQLKQDFKVDVAAQEIHDLWVNLFGSYGFSYTVIERSVEMVFALYVLYPEKRVRLNRLRIYGDLVEQEGHYATDRFDMLHDLVLFCLKNDILIEDLWMGRGRKGDEVKLWQ